MFAALSFLQESVKFAPYTYLGIVGPWVWDPWWLRPRGSSLFVRAISSFIDLLLFNGTIRTAKITCVAHVILLLGSAAVAPWFRQQWPSSRLRRQTPASLSHSPAYVPRWVFARPHYYLWCPHPCCLCVCREDPGSRAPGLSSGTFHLGNLTSQPPSGSHCVFFIR